MLGQNLMEGAWFWKAPISNSFLTMELVTNLKYKTSAWACIGVNELAAGF